MRSRSSEPAHVARQLIERHGLRASAVAQEYVSEASLSGEASRSHHWRQVQAAINDLRRTRRAQEAASHLDD